MASKLSKDDDEKDFLMCGICLDFYDDRDHTPKIMECFHSCCLTCLKSHAVTPVITCPYCRKETTIKNGVENMTTNFYIMPSVQKLMAKRKEIEDMLAKTKDNWAEAIARRRNAQGKLKMVQDALKMLEHTIIQKSEDNNEKIAIMQSLLEDPFAKQDMEELLASYSKCESDHKQSKEDLTVADHMSNSLYDIEDYVFSLSLKNKNNGTNFNIKALEDKKLAFSNKSIHGPHMGSYQSILSFILFQMKEENHWSATDHTENGTNQAGSNIPNGNTNERESKRSQLPGWLNDETSTDSESSSSGEEQQTMCYMQFKINNIIQPKVIFRLNFDEAPKMSQRFMDYCTGSNGLSYKECPIFTNKNGESFTVGKYEDLQIQQDQHGYAGELPVGWCDGRTQRFIADHSTLDESVGALRMRHRGRSIEGVYVCSEFSVICRDHPNNSQMTTVFGYVHSGIEICRNISRLDLENFNVAIHSCGVWSG